MNTPTNKERYVSDVIEEMSPAQRNAVELLCVYASGKLKSVTKEVRDAAVLVKYEMTTEQQKTAYYLIAKAESDHKKPIILQLFM